MKEEGSRELEKKRRKLRQGTIKGGEEGEKKKREEKVFSFRLQFGLSFQCFIFKNFVFSLRDQLCIFIL